MKRIALIAAILVCTLLLAACAPTAFQKVNPNQFLTLGEYKGMTDKERPAEVTEFDINAQINMAMKKAGYAEEVYNTQESGVVAFNNMVNIDYKGTKDGVAFNSGTAEGASLTIGSNTFIRGFESQLIGVKVGDTVNIPLTFPSDYSNAELAGQDVIFTVVVNSITGKINYPALTDKIAQELDKDVQTVDELRQKIRTSLEEEYKAEAETLQKNHLWIQVLEGVSLKKKIPSSLLKPLAKEYDAYYLSLAKQYGYDSLDELLKASQVSEKDFGERRNNYCENQAKTILVAYAIAEAEGYSVSEEALNAKAKEMAKAAGYSDPTTYLNAIGRDRLNDQLILDYAVETVLKNAKIR
jgi:trigger factor